MHLFYSPDITDNYSILSAEESAHCIRVLRMKRGDNLNLIDGKGHLFDARIEDPDPAKCRVIITRTEIMPSPRKSRLHIAIAPTKSIDRFEWFIEKTIEIGVDVITPVICQRSERRTLKAERLDKLVISTMKQAKIYTKPLINDIIELNALLIKLGKTYPERYIAHCDTAGNKFLADILVAGNDTLILIGPEGDFTPGEIEITLQNRFTPVSLGENRLRTETAGLVAAVLANITLGSKKS